MTSSRGRLAIVAGALLILSTVGAGLAQGASASAASTAAAGDATMVAALAPTDPAADQLLLIGERLRALRERLGDGRLGRLGKHFVHGTFTVLDRDGKLITLQLDHGTISAIDHDSITIAEAGDTTVIVATTDDTRVRKSRAPAALTALAVGDEVFVRSVVEGGSATARFILVPPPRPAAGTPSAGS